MSTDLRKPGVYVEESLLLGTPDVSAATSVALFVGAAGKGPISYPVLLNSWSDYVLSFGAFDTMVGPAGDTNVYTTYLPYAVYSYFQNGGQPAYVYRAVGSTSGGAAELTVTDGQSEFATVQSVQFTAGTGQDTGTGRVTITTVGPHGYDAEDMVSTVVDTNTFVNATAGVSVISDTKYAYYITSDHIDMTDTPDTGVASTTGEEVFTVSANSVGSGGNSLGITIQIVDPINGVFNLSIYSNTTEVERFQYLTMTGDTPGTRKLDAAINDPYSGSTLVRVSNPDSTLVPASISNIMNLYGGVDPGLPDPATDFITTAQAAAGVIDGPIIVNLVGYTTNTNDPDAFQIPAAVSSATFGDRGDIFVVNDGAKQRPYNLSPAAYKTSLSATLGQNAGDSYTASFTPWIIIPDPKSAGATITVPPGGAVAGVISRVDSTIGVFRAPAGIVAQVTNAVGVDTKFSDNDLGDLNVSNINVIRPVQGQGIAVMGARTRKLYGADRYISGRRTLIYIKESLRRSTQYALFENNDQRLWSQLIMTAERLLRPLWEAGGLRGNNATQAYYIQCDDVINTPAMIQSGEVRMEVGVSLEYPAEFIVIRVTQFESGGTTAEVIQPVGPTG
jgi:phage tail sheath protein FI